MLLPADFVASLRKAVFMLELAREKQLKSIDMHDTIWELLESVESMAREMREEMDREGKRA